MSFPWFAVQVRTRAEALVEMALRGKQYETFLPTYLETRQYSGLVKKIPAPLFPGYLFCRLDPDRPLPILTTRGVQRIVSFSDRPIPVEESEVAAIQRLVSARDMARPWPYRKTGDHVRVEIGPFAGVEGILVSENGADWLVVSVTLLRRSVAVEIDRSSLGSVASRSALDPVT